VTASPDSGRAAKLRSRDVFVNCPFDRSYQPVFDAIIFTWRSLAFVPRCALELVDSGEIRLEKNMRLVEQCRYGIHDISSAGLDPETQLPRFNMPLELGVFLGCKRFGGDVQRRKNCLILDSEPFRYRAFISDIAGQDIHHHGGEPERATIEVRNWLATVSRRKGLPGGAGVASRYKIFQQDLPGLCARLKREPARLTFVDLTGMIEIRIEANA
jgi:hypothetical protein